MRTLIAAFLVLLASVAMASPTEKMTAEDAARLDAAAAHEALVMEAAKTQAAPYEKTIQELCRKYKIDRAELGKGVGVDVETGEIKRAPKAAANEDKKASATSAAATKAPPPPPGARK